MTAPKPVLSLFDGIAITVGIVVGAGIFSLPSFIAGGVPDKTAFLLIWVAGGVVSLIGALCFAELATAYPSAGGEYNFLTRAYGHKVGFMFAWARATVVQTGSIALLAYIFGDYFCRLIGVDPSYAPVAAAVIIAILTLLNLAGVRETKTVQDILFACSMIGLVSVIATGLVLLTPFGQAQGVPPAAESGEVTFAGVSTGMVLALLAYGGWNEAAYISAELKNPRRNMVRMLVISIGLITALYVAVCYVYVSVLGTAGLAATTTVARDLMEAAFGPGGGIFITVLILVIVVDTLNVTIFTGARLNFALGRDFPMFGFLAHWSERGAPSRGILLQSAIALLLVGGASFIGANQAGVQTMVDYLSPVFWVFFLLTGLSLFVLRAKDPGTERPFKVPLYPITPALFCLTSTYLLYSSLAFTGMGAIAGVVVLALGLPFLFFAHSRPALAGQSSTPPA